jgi:hypothetical protein
MLPPRSGVYTVFTCMAHLDREYIAYLAREITHRLLDRKLISAADPAALTEAVRQAMDEEFAVEQRINEEARAILGQHEAEMQRLGASYSEAFKKVKAELVRKHKVVL